MTETHTDIQTQQNAASASGTYDKTTLHPPASSHVVSHTSEAPNDPLNLNLLTGRLCLRGFDVAQNPDKDNFDPRTQRETTQNLIMLRWLGFN